MHLVSNLFSTGNDKANNSAFTTYRTLWGDGPAIPLFAKILLKKSDDKEVEVPEAVGKVRLQWDYEDEAEDVSRHFTEAKEYLEASLDRYRDTTKPKGDNCHRDHGGKRGDDGKSVFPAQAGYAPEDALNRASSRSRSSRPRPASGPPTARRGRRESSRAGAACSSSPRAWPETPSS